MKLKRAFVAMSGGALLVVSAWAARHHLPTHAATIANAAPASSHPRKELWVTHQRDSAISILKFPSGELLDGFSLPAGTQPHIITFHSGKYAYISGMGNGTLSIIDADSRQLVKTLNFAPALCHQGKVSPDGSTMLVSVFSTRKLHKVAVDEDSHSWVPLGSLDFPAGKGPVCSVFRADSQRAYVSMMPSGIAVVDVPSMTILNTLPTDGFIACGMIKPDEDADHAVIAASGGGGHIYTLDMTNDTLVDRGTLGAASWHGFNMNRDATLGFGTSPLSDEVVAIDLTTQPVTKLGTILLQPLTRTGSTANNQPDALGGGEVIVDGTLPVSLRAAGQLALIDADSLDIDSFVKIADPSPPGTFSTMTCIGCSVHGVTVRPRDHRDGNGDDDRSQPR
jgi:DNA-binding beta-propeller fold protein YncE